MDRCLKRKEGAATPASIPQSGTLFRGCQLPEDWKVHDGSLLVLQHCVPQDSFCKAAVLDFDDTLACRGSRDGMSKLVMPRDLMFKNVVGVMRRLHESGYCLVILTNESSIARFKTQETINRAVQSKTGRLSTFLEHFGDTPVLVLVASGTDKYRKGHGIGAWEYVMEQTQGRLVAEQSIMCGDAAGRPGDFSDSDRAFATATKLKFFTPEELFGQDASTTLDDLCCANDLSHHTTVLASDDVDEAAAKQPRLDDP